MHLDLKDHVTRLTYFALNLLDEIQTAPDDVDAEECRALCLEQLREFDRCTTMRATFGLAKYALTAWIDDLLSRARWPHAALWKSQSLEQELFGTTCRHWRFFEQAELALRRRDWDALSVFQFCVEFGFRGIYAKDRVKVRLTDRLPMTRAPETSELAPPILAGVLQETGQGSKTHLGNRRPNATLAVVISSPTPVLPPTLDEWCQNTFDRLGERYPMSSRSRLGLDPSFPTGKYLTDWAIVMAVGLLLFGVLFAIGH
jgi:type IV/VI secretion system ImpK/VasF family protein